jgi:putative nucleotidyltransferase with HDIG domain
MKKRLLTILPFAVAALILVAIMPHGSRFKYHFEKGNAWQYPTLNADYDFPLHKSAAELNAERNRLLDDFSPYYKSDTTIARQQIAALADSFRHIFHKPLPESFTTILRYVYEKGIRNDSRAGESFLDSTSIFYVVEAHIARPAAVSETFLPQSAATFVLKKISAIRNLSTAERNYLLRLNWQRHLAPNFIFDYELSAAAKQERLAMLSPTRGIVSRGEHIVTRGEIVNAEIYRKLDSYRREHSLRLGFAGNIWLLLTGQAILALLIMAALLAYLHFFQPKRLSFKNNCFLALLIVLFAGMTRWAAGTGIYIVPFALLAIYVGTFMGHRTAIVTLAAAVLLAATSAPAPYDFIVINTGTGFAAIFFARNSYRRSSLYSCAIWVFMICCLLYLALLLINDGNVADFSPRTIFHFAINAALVIAGYQLIFALEKIFGYISNTTLIEIADTNQPLLRLLAEKAPATFQHCVQVANLAETAIGRIGGNPLLVRAGALYHDIGKLQNPSYFIENQVLGYNPHNNISPEESSQIIIRHVSDGVDIAHKFRLPKHIINFILSHHGTARTRYFYRIYKERHPDAVDFSAFTYNGINPTTREQAVVMLADVVEAASRTLASYSAENIDAMVESAIDTVVADKVLNDSPLTFADIGTIKYAFKKKLLNIYHARGIDYGTLGIKGGE